MSQGWMPQLLLEEGVGHVGGEVSLGDVMSPEAVHQVHRLALLPEQCVTGHEDLVGQVRGDLLSWPGPAAGRGRVEPQSACPA